MRVGVDTRLRAPAYRGAHESDPREIPNPTPWEAEGEIAIRDGQFKCGCKTLTTIGEIPLPKITTEMRVRFAIMCAQEVCACRTWNAWADKWLSGEDRSEAADAAAAREADAARAAAWAAWAAEAAAYRSAQAAEAAAQAAAAAAWAAWAAREVGHDGIDIFDIAEKACVSKTVG